MSRELRKVLELDQSEDESEGELGRPSAPFPTPSTITRISERGEGKEGYCLKCQKLGNITTAKEVYIAVALETLFQRCFYHFKLLMFTLHVRSTGTKIIFRIMLSMFKFFFFLVSFSVPKSLFCTDTLTVHHYC